MLLNNAQYFRFNLPSSVFIIHILSIGVCHFVIHIYVFSTLASCDRLYVFPCLCVVYILSITATKDCNGLSCSNFRLSAHIADLLKTGLATKKRNRNLSSNPSFPFKPTNSVISGSGCISKHIDIDVLLNPLS